MNKRVFICGYTVSLYPSNSGYCVSQYDKYCRTVRDIFVFSYEEAEKYFSLFCKDLKKSAKQHTPSF